MFQQKHLPFFVVAICDLRSRDIFCLPAKFDIGSFYSPAI